MVFGDNGSAVNTSVRRHLDGGSVHKWAAIPSVVYPYTYILCLKVTHRLSTEVQPPEF